MSERERDALGRLYQALRERHHGRMPQEVQDAYDHAGEVLRTPSPEREVGDGRWAHRLIASEQSRGEGARWDPANPPYPVGTLVNYYGVPHRVIDAGKQGARLAALRTPSPPAPAEIDTASHEVGPKDTAVGTDGEVTLADQAEKLWEELWDRRVIDVDQGDVFRDIVARLRSEPPALPEWDPEDHSLPSPEVASAYLRQMATDSRYPANDKRCLLAAAKLLAPTDRPEENDAE